MCLALRVPAFISSTERERGEGGRRLGSICKADMKGGRLIIGCVRVDSGHSSERALWDGCSVLDSMEESGLNNDDGKFLLNYEQASSAQ